MRSFVLGALLGLTSGLLVAFLPLAHGDRASAPVTPRPSRVEPVPVVRCSASLSAEDVARLRDEIVAELRPTATSPSPTPPTTPPGPEAEGAEHAAAEMLDRALASGAWSRLDRMLYQRFAGAMSEEARVRALSALTMAINDQRLKLEPPDAP